MCRKLSTDAGRRGETCYQFTVDNITLAPALSGVPGTAPGGTNTILLHVISTPSDNFDDPGIHQIACVRPRYQASPETTNPPSATMNVPITAFKPPDSPMEEMALTRFATASSPSFAIRPSPRRGRASGASPCRSVALLAFVLMGLAVACESKASSPDASAGQTCAPNVASSSGTAATLTSGQSVENRICFEGSSNWYVISVPSGNTLLDVTAGYAGASTLPGPAGRQGVLPDQQHDADVRPGARGAHRVGRRSQSIQTTLHAVQSGAYYIQAADTHNVNFDPTNAYTLTVGYAADPDSHEPNDTTADAKSSDSKPGYLSYLNDLDIFKTSVANAGDLLTLSIGNPATASAPVDYGITSSTGSILAEGKAPPQAAPLQTQLMVSASGTYYVALSFSQGDRSESQLLRRVHAELRLDGKPRHAQ